MILVAILPYLQRTPLRGISICIKKHIKMKADLKAFFKNGIFEGIFLSFFQSVNPLFDLFLQTI